MIYLQKPTQGWYVDSGSHLDEGGGVGGVLFSGGVSCPRDAVSRDLIEMHTSHRSEHRFLLLIFRITAYV